MILEPPKQDSFVIVPGICWCPSKFWIYYIGEEDKIIINHTFYAFFDIFNKKS